MIKNKNRGGFDDHQSKRVGVGEEDAFENEKKKKSNVCVQANLRRVRPMKGTLDSGILEILTLNMESGIRENFT